MDSTFLPGALQSLKTLSYVCAALVLVVILLSVLSIFTFIMLIRLKKRYNSFMYRKNVSGISVETLLDECLEETRAVEEGFASLRSRTAALESQITGCFQKIGVVRYNPFEDTGGDLSYVVALLNENNTGFVLNGIYNRSGSYTYAKEIENGVAVRHKLSAEELQALQTAISGSANNGIY